MKTDNKLRIRVSEEEQAFLDKGCFPLCIDSGAGSQVIADMADPTTQKEYGEKLVKAFNATYGEGIDPDKLEDKTYSLCEAVADISYIAGEHKFYSGDSRADNFTLIQWAKEFEQANVGIVWGVDKEYIDEITAFAESKIKSFTDYK